MSFIEIEIDEWHIVPDDWRLIDIEHDRGERRHRRVVIVEVEEDYALATREELLCALEEAGNDYPPRLRVLTRHGEGEYLDQRVHITLKDERADTVIALNERLAAHKAGAIRVGGGSDRVIVRRDELGDPGAEGRSRALLRDLGKVCAITDAQDWIVTDNRDGPKGSHDTRWPEGRPFDFGPSEFEDAMRVKPAGSEWFPPSYLPISGLDQRAAFDPALKQYLAAYRAGEPKSPTPEWTALRASALDQLAASIARAGLAEKLVLRGSVPMRTWFGDEARTPGDLDVVVRPHTIRADTPEAKELLDALVDTIRRDPGPLDPAGLVTEDIWTYERAEGRRLVFPVADGHTRAHVQLDVVFAEELPREPVPVTVGGTELLAATKELSLAWKLQWLHTDRYPQGKDLYDAVLLAESTRIDHDLVRELLLEDLGTAAGDWMPASVLALRPDWRNFRDEYPRVGDGPEEWLKRLARALER